MLKRVLDWLDERIEVRNLWETMTNRPIPGGSSWFYVLGSSLLFVFALQMVTGILLTLYYAPVPDHAYQSVKYIQEEALFGSFVRGLHHWGATFMVVLVSLHMLRVFVFGAYKKPREVVWLVGTGLFLIVFGFAFTGYLLPWDQKAYWATVVGTNMLGSLPLLGEPLRTLLLGGAEVSGRTLLRFYSIHMLWLPVLTGLFLWVHFHMIRRLGISGGM